MQCRRDKSMQQLYQVIHGILKIKKKKRVIHGITQRMNDMRSNYILFGIGGPTNFPQSIQQLG